MNNNNCNSGNNNGAINNNSNNFAQQHSSHHSSPTTIGSTTTGTDLNGGQQMHTFVHHPESGGNNTVPDSPQPQQSQPHFQTQTQHRYLHRDGPATINLPPGTRIQMSSSDQVDTNSFQQQEAAAAMYGQMAYQQAAVGAAAASWQASGYGGAGQISQPGQYYTTFNPATGQYYANPTGNYALTAPQALIMQQSQQAAAAAHQQQVAVAQYAQFMGQHQHGINQAVAHNPMIATSGIAVQQQQMPVATGVSHLQQSNVAVTSAGTLAAPVISTLAGGIQSPNPTAVMQSSSAQQQQPVQQPSKGRKILNIVNPETGKALDFGTESKVATTINVIGTAAATMNEENKSAVIISEFQKKVTERANSETAAAALNGAETAQSRRSPSFPNEVPQQQQQVPEPIISSRIGGAAAGAMYSGMPKSASGVELHSTPVGITGIGGYDAPHSVPPKMPTPPTTATSMGSAPLPQTVQSMPLSASAQPYHPVGSGGSSQLPVFQIQQQQKQQHQPPQHHHAPPSIITTTAVPVTSSHSIHPHVPPTTHAYPTPLLPPSPSHPIPIEQQQQAPPMHHSPKMPSLMEIEVSKPSLQEEQPQQQQQPIPLLQPPQQHQQQQQLAQQKNHYHGPFVPTSNTLISTTHQNTKMPLATTASPLDLTESTKHTVDHLTEEQLRQPVKSGDKRNNHVPELELNGQSPTPTEWTEEPETPSTEELEDFEKKMQEYDEMRNDDHDPDAMIYCRSFLMFLRKVTHRVKAVKCPKTDDELEELGLSNKGLPPSQATIGTGKAKRFDLPGGENSFKPAWQQSGGGMGGGNQYGGGVGGGQRFISRPPYSGRHSDNKLKPKKGPMVGRPSLDQRPIKLAQVSHQADTLPRKSANAWKPKREERFDMNAPMKDEQEAKYEQIKKDVRGLLNKITPSTYDELSNEFCEKKITEDPKLLSPIIDLIFDKAVEEPHFCPLYSDLCKKQVEAERQFQRDKTPDNTQQQKDKSFRNAIILKCQNTFNDSKSYDEKMQVLEAKVKELSEDREARLPIEDEIETLRSKEKRRLLGIIKFIGQLYRHQLVIEMIIYWCAVELIKRFDATTDEVYIEYAVQLVNTVGKIYEERFEERKKQAEKVQPKQAHEQPKPAQTGRTVSQVASGESKTVNEQQQKTEFRLDNILAHLFKLKQQVSSRVRFAIMDLEDLRKNGWNPRGGEKGPKTIEEVREEAIKEQQDNELERIEHEKQKEKERQQQQGSGTMRKSSSRSYMGRNSTDRRTAARQASSLLARESKAESRITGTSRLSELDSMTGLGRSTWKTHRDRTPQKDEGGGGLSPSASGSSAGGGGTTSGGGGSSGHAWRSMKSGTDSPKEE